jgi:trypsin-like peptidase/colicin V production protein
VTWVDWLAVGIVVVAAVGGASQGLVWSGLSFAGLLAGAFLGGHYVAPHLLAREAHSPYAPLIALACAVGLAVLFETVGSAIGAALGQRVRGSPFGGVDMVGGLIVGAVSGLAIIWVLGAVALNLPGRTKLRRDLQRSAVIRELNSIVPPRRFLNLLARLDPLPSLAGPALPDKPPDPRVLNAPGAHRASPAVVRILGTACGFGVEGSGWVAGPGIVVTAAHVVAGEDDTTVEPSSGGSLRAQAVGFDPHNDVAVLRVPGLGEPPLRVADSRPGTAVAILGYPENGPFDAEPGRIGTTASVFTQDAYGRPTFRTVTSFSGRVQPGNSGGPAVDVTGAVQTTVFASRTAGGGGFGVPGFIVRRELAGARNGVSTGPCAR